MSSHPLDSPSPPLARGPIRSVLVFCGSRSGVDPRHAALAAEVGALLASRGVGLVYGGGALGLMGECGRAAIARGGRVEGVIPRFLKDWEVAEPSCRDMIVVDSLHTRKHLMFDHADAVLKSKKDSSMAVGFNLLKNGEGDAFVSAGNSGALCMGATLAVKRIKGIKRPAFSPVMPSANGFFMLVDGGANVDCRPEMLVQFAVMGSIYMNRVMNIDNPRVGLANVGTEDHKGTDLYQTTYQLLK